MLAIISSGCGIEKNGFLGDKFILIKNPYILHIQPFNWVILVKAGHANLPNWRDSALIYLLQHLKKIRYFSF